MAKCDLSECVGVRWSQRRAGNHPVQRFVEVTRARKESDTENGKL